MCDRPRGSGWVGDVLDKISLRVVVVLSHENLSAYGDVRLVVYVCYFVVTTARYICILSRILPSDA